VGAALFSIAIVLLTSRALTRFGPGTAAPVAYAVSGAIFLGIWPLVRISPAGAAVALYLHLTVGGSILISWFWSVITERFDPRTARKRIGRIAAGGTLGGIAGGLLAERTAAMESVSGAALLPLLALLHLLCAGAILRLQAGRQEAPAAATAAPDADADASGGWQAGLRTLRHAPYLRQLAALVMVSTIAAAFLDFLFKSHASLRFTDTESLLRFFALFYTATGVLTFAVQSTLTRRLLESVGLARTAAVLPFAVGAGALALLVPGLLGIWLATAVRGGESILRSSVFRSSYELFYTPVSPRDKRAAKTLVDVGFERLGDAIGGGAIQAVLFVAAVFVATDSVGPPRVALLVMAGFAVALGLAGLFIATRLELGYVTALERSLLDRAIDVDPGLVEDDTTRTAVLRTIGSLNVSDVLARAGEPAAPAATARHPSPTPTATPPTAQAPPALPADPLVSRIIELRSRDAARVHAALAAPMDRTGVPHAIRLLGWDEVAETVIQALRPNCDRYAGQLIDALLDADEDFVIRRRIPRILTVGRSRRIVRGLMYGLADKRFEVRFQCGAALTRIRDRQPTIQLSRSRILEAIQSEAAVDRRVWESHRLLDRLDSDEQTPFVDEVLRERSSRSLEHVFTMLSLVYPKEPLQIAYRGLHTSDENLRGTALEYLESILPAAVRQNLWPLLEDHRGRESEGRTQDEILNSLLSSHDSIRVNLETLRGRGRDKSK